MKTLSRLRASVSLLLVIFLIFGPTASSYAKDDPDKYGEDFWTGVFLTAFSTAGTLLASSVVAAPAGLLLGGIEITTMVLCEEFGCEDGVAAPPPDDSKRSSHGRNFDEVFLADEVDIPRPAAPGVPSFSIEVEEGLAILEDVIEDKRSLTVTVGRYHRARERPGKTCTYGGAKIPCYEMQILHGQWLVDRLDSNLRALVVPLRALARSEAVDGVTVTRDEIAEFVADFHATGPPPFEEDLLRAIGATPRERQLLARGHAVEIGPEEWEIPLADLLAESAVRLLEGRLLRFGTALPAEFLSSRDKAPVLDWDIGTFESETRVERRIVAKNISCPGKQTFEMHALATPWLEIEPDQKLDKIPVGASKEARLDIDLERLPAGEHYGLMTVGCVTCPPPPKCTHSGRRMLVRVVKKSGEAREETSVPARAELDVRRSWPRPHPEARIVSTAEYHQAVEDFKEAFAAADEARVRLEAMRPPIETPPDPIDCYFHPWHPGCEVIWDPFRDRVVWRDAVTKNLVPECGPGTPQAIHPVAGAALTWLVGKALDYTWDVGVCLYEADGPDGRGLEGPDGIQKFGNCFVEAASGREGRSR